MRESWLRNFSSQSALRPMLHLRLRQVPESQAETHMVLSVPNSPYMDWLSKSWCLNTGGSHFSGMYNSPLLSAVYFLQPFLTLSLLQIPTHYGLWPWHMNTHIIMWKWNNNPRGDDSESRVLVSVCLLSVCLLFISLSVRPYLDFSEVFRFARNSPRGNRTICKNSRRFFLQKESSRGRGTIRTCIHDLPFFLRSKHIWE